jgi:hypothetical protein
VPGKRGRPTSLPNYPWDKWLDGEVHVLRVPPSCEPAFLDKWLRVAAKQRKKGISIRTLERHMLVKALDE